VRVLLGIVLALCMTPNLATAAIHGLTTSKNAILVAGSGWGGIPSAQPANDGVAIGAITDASVSGSTLTVSDCGSATLAINQWVNTGIALEEIQALGTGTGCNGTYTLFDASSNGASGSMSQYDVGYNDAVIAAYDVPEYIESSPATPTVYFTVDALHLPPSGVGSNDASVTCQMDAGPYITVLASQKSTNPQTGTFGYVFGFGAGLSPNAIGREIRCFAHAANGQPTVLQGAVATTGSTAAAALVKSLWVTINDQVANQQPNDWAYWGASGSDSNGCAYTAKQTTPVYCATISGALAKLEALRGNQTSLSGSTIQIAPGDTGAYTFDQTTFSFHGTNRYVTVDMTPAPLAYLYDLGGIKVAPLVHALNANYNLSGHATVGNLGFGAGSGDCSSGSPGYCGVWVDGGVDVGPGEGYANGAIALASGSGGTWKWGIYVTNVTYSGGQNGCLNAALCRNLIVHDISSDGFQSSTVILNSLTYNAGDFGYLATGDITSGSNCIANVSNMAVFNANYNGQSPFATIELAPHGTVGLSGATVTGTGTCAGANSVTLSVNSTVTITGASFEFGTHADVFQYINASTNSFLIDGLFANTDIVSQAVDNTNATPVQAVNAAVVNSTFNVPNSGLSAGLFAMQWLQKTRNFLWINNVWNGQMVWNTTNSFSAQDVAVLENTCNTGTGHITNSAGSYPVAGVITRGSAGC
jgi:hypothetical protein